MFKICDLWTVILWYELNPRVRWPLAMFFLYSYNILPQDSDLISAAGQDLRDETRSFAQETQSLERNMTELATSSDYFQDRISTLKRTFEVWHVFILKFWRKLFQEIVGRIPAKVVKKYIPADILKAKVPDSTLQQLDDGTFEEVCGTYYVRSM